MAEQIDLRPQIVDILVWRGDAWSVEATITNPDGQPLDLTDTDVSGRVSPDVPLVINILDAAEGRFTYGQAIADKAGRYDVQVTPNGGPPRTYVAGKLKVYADVTPAV